MQDLLDNLLRMRCKHSGGGMLNSFNCDGFTLEGLVWALGSDFVQAASSGEPFAEGMFAHHSFNSLSGVHKFVGSATALMALFDGLDVSAGVDIDGHGLIRVLPYDEQCIPHASVIIKMAVYDNTAGQFVCPHFFGVCVPLQPACAFSFLISRRTGTLLLPPPCQVLARGCLPERSHVSVGQWTECQEDCTRQEE